MNANFGLLPPLAAAIRDRRMRKLALAERSLGAMDSWIGLFA
jgi:folate-dependent tRNA-U54 methylase TrmFO/GidA